MIINAHRRSKEEMPVHTMFYKHSVRGIPHGTSWCQYVFHCIATQTHNILFMAFKHVKQWFSRGVHKSIGSWLFQSLSLKQCISASSEHSALIHVKVILDARQRKKTYYLYPIASQEIYQWNCNYLTEVSKCSPWMLTLSVLWEDRSVHSLNSSLTKL